MMSIIAGIVIIGFSLLFTTVAFPEYFSELEASYRDVLRQQGKTEAEIASEIAAWAAGQTLDDPGLERLPGHLRDRRGGDRGGGAVGESASLAAGGSRVLAVSRGSRGPGTSSKPQNLSRSPQNLIEVPEP